MSERRTDNRLEVCLDAVWDGALGDRHTRIADLSAGGCYIDSIAEVYVGEFLRLKIQLPNGQWLELMGEVAHRVSRLGFGVRFVDLANEQLMTLQWLITHLEDRLSNDDPLRNNLVEIKKTSTRATALTRQLLSFSRKEMLQAKVIDLNAIVGDMDTMLRRLIGEDIDLITLLEPSSCEVKADPGQIDQVIMNLAVNARDAMPLGGKLTIETGLVHLDETYSLAQVAVKSGTYVMLAVSDTGSGMDAETKKHLFEPFFTTKEPGKGTGLGLSTVYGIVNQSGGTIWVYSELGQGTTFKVYLPVVSESVAPEIKSTTPESLQGRETVLLVEDEEMVRKLSREILEINGYRVLSAANGQEACQLCESYDGEIHLMITDVVMPQMSGRELAERVLKERPDILILYMSGYTDEAIVRHGVLEDSMPFLQKPFTPDSFTQKVSELLERLPVGQLL